MYAVLALSCLIVCGLYDRMRVLFFEIESNESHWRSPVVAMIDNNHWITLYERLSNSRLKF